MSTSFLFPEGGKTATAVAPSDAGVVSGVGDFIVKASRAQRKAAATVSAPRVVPQTASTRFHKASLPKRGIIDSSGKLRVVRDHTKDQDAIFTGPNAATRHEAAYESDDRYNVTDDPLSGSHTKQESLERIKVMQKVRWAFENDGVCETVELAKRRYCEPIKWRAKFGDDAQRKRLTDFIAREMEADRYDLAGAADLPTMVKSKVIDWGLDGDIFTNMVTPSGMDTFLCQPIRAHRIGRESSGSLDVTDEINDFFEIRHNKPRFREVGGIVLDSRDRRRAIRVYEEKEDDLQNFDVLGLNKGRKAKNISFNQILQTYDPRHVDRVRELSRWSTAIDPVMDLRQTWDYLQVTLKAQAGMPFVQTAPAKSGGSLPVDPNTGRASLKRNLPSAKTDAGIDVPTEMIPGKIQQLPFGAELRDFAARRPNAQFKDCVRHLLHNSAWSSEIPYPFVYDSSGSNGGSLRLENDKAANAFHAIQRVICKTDLNPWVRAKIKMGIETGHRLLRGFSMADLSLLAAGEWSFPPLPTADEKYRSSATIASWEAGMSSLDDVVQPLGKSADEVMEEKARELRKKATLAAEVASEFPEQLSFHMAFDNIGKMGPNGSVPFANDLVEKKSSSSGSQNSTSDTSAGAGDAGGGGARNDAFSGLKALEMEERVAAVEDRISEVTESVEQLEMFEPEAVQKPTQKPAPAASAKK